MLQLRFWCERLQLPLPALQAELDGLIPSAIALYGTSRDLQLSGLQVAPLIDGDLLRSQRDAFIQLMRAMAAVQQPEQQTTPQVWASMFGSGAGGGMQRRRQLSEFIKLYKISAVFPIGSIENERHFSWMNLIHNALRNRLLAPHLNTCMRIAASSHTWENFDVLAAHTAWYASGRYMADR